MSNTDVERERRSDSLSKRIGDLLLKGHRMLATECQVCNNILMQDRQGTIMCIACNEERDTSGDAFSKIEEMQTQVLQVGGGDGEPGTKPSLSATVDLLLTEITAATANLQNIPPGADLHLKQTYIRHIRDCAETIHALRQISTAN